ncbi:MAG TPA: signal recognition particle-docking protein FtsY [Waterburya sp.]|jgi:fused signal recognition particle receptor
MVFNWFRRQFGTSEESSQETQSDIPQVEEEQQATQEQSAAVDEDYLSWAKAAYKNIQKQQPSQAAEPTSAEPEEEPSTTATAEAITEAESASVESAVSETEVETPPVAEAATAQIADQTAETTLPEAEALPDVVSPEAQEAVAAVEAPATETAVEPETIETVAPVAEQAEEQVAVESAVPISEVPATETAVEPEAQTIETLTPAAEEQVAVESEALLPAAVEAEATPAAPVPIWARSSAERQARLDRLKETAIELPEPEPARTPAQSGASGATTVEMEEIPGLAFDEGFLWSAQVLAAQGRRPEDVSVEEISWLNRLRQGLDKTRRSLINQLKAIVGQGPLNQDAVMEIEALLLQADVGIEATDYIIDTLQKKLREETLPPEQAIAYLKEILRDLLDRPYQESYSSTFVPEKDTLNIWLMTGVNGAGKTTTIGKMAHLAQKSGYHCLLGAADTFRAAAVEQLKIWGERSGTEVIANPGKNTDPAAVVFDAITAAQSRNTELLLIDTAGRLQNKKNLMEELAKIRRIIDKKAPNAKVESLLVLDATLGQNGLRQAEVFSQAAKLSGVVLTKLDSTAKGGVALAVVRELGLPIRFIGAGEGIEDLRPFSSYEFVEALLSG